jgi:hypothetical protein
MSKISGSNMEVFIKKLIRIWKIGEGYSEERFMNEHIVVNSSEIICLEHDIVDENLNCINWLTAKHLNYA